MLSRSQSKKEYSGLYPGKRKESIFDIRSLKRLLTGMTCGLALTGFWSLPRNWVERKSNLRPDRKLVSLGPSRTSAQESKILASLCWKLQTEVPGNANA